MDVKIKHVYGGGEAAAMDYQLQLPSVPDGDDGCVVTATIHGAPSGRMALAAANASVFWPRLRSANFTELAPGRIIR